MSNQAEAYPPKDVTIHWKGESGVTLLHLAADEGDVERVKDLIAQRADINALTDSGVSPLHLALLSATRVPNKERLAAIHCLLSAGADVYQADDRGSTPLHYAAELGEPTIFRLLIERGANVNARDETDSTPLHYSSSPGISVILIQNGAQVPDAFAAVRSGDVAIVESFMASEGNPNDRGPYGSTPLHEAAVCDYPDIAKCLLKHGADPNAIDDSNETPLHQTRSKALADVLLTHGAKVPDIEAAIRTGDPHYVQLFLDQGESPNTPAGRLDGMTILHDAVEFGYIEIVELLLSRDADINIQDHVLGWTPLHLASRRNRLEMAQFLLDHAADIKVTDRIGMSALSWARDKGHDHACRLLVAQGVSNSKELGNR